MRCWCGYLSGARCRLFAYGPADATAVPKPSRLLPRLNPDWFYLSGTGLPMSANGCSSRRVLVVVIKDRVGHCSHSMRQALCNGTVSVRLSVRLSTAAAACRRRVCCWAPRLQRTSIDSGGRSSSAVSSKCEQCRVVSRRRKLNTDLLQLGDG